MTRVSQAYTDRFSRGCKKTAEGLVEMATTAAEVRAEYGYPEYVEWLHEKFRLKQRMANNLLAIHRNLLTANFAVETEWTNFAPSALYILASPSTPTEAINEAVELANDGSMVTHAIAQNIIGRAIRVAGALNEASEQVTQFVTEKGIDDPELIDDLKRLEASSSEPGSNGTFVEIVTTGGFHYGDDMSKWCDIANAPAKERYEALRSITHQHIQQTANTRDEAIAELIEAAKGLSAYRHRSGALNFQLEKADAYIYRMRSALVALGIELT